MNHQTDALDFGFICKTSNISAKYLEEEEEEQVVLAGKGLGRETPGNDCSGGKNLWKKPRCPIPFSSSIQKEGC